MIRGMFIGAPPYRRPFIKAQVTNPLLGISTSVLFLVDTGADLTLLGPADADRLKIDLSTLPLTLPTEGVGGAVPTAIARVTIMLGREPYELSVRVLRPSSPAQREALRRVPSLGRAGWSQD